MKKIVFLILTSCLIAFSFINVKAIEKERNDLFDYKNLLYQLNGVGFNVEEIEVKTAKDFVDNEYIIGETNNGYFVYSKEVDSLLEYSLKAKSPYAEYNKDIIYGGPGAYFVKEGTNYLSILEGEVYEDNKILHTSAIANKEVEIIENYTLVSTSSLPLVFEWKVNHPEFFRDECYTYCGYISGGYCGFIGLGMLIGYADKYKNDGIMDNKYYQDPSAKTGLKNGSESISKLLYDSNPKDSTTSMHIKTVMKDYAKSRNISISYTSRWTPFFTVTTISDALKNDTPVELFGTFKYEINDTTKSTGNHAIVAYEMGYVPSMGSSTYGYKCHLGWSNYGEVVITSYTLGSIFFFNCK